VNPGTGDDERYRIRVGSKEELVSKAKSALNELGNFLSEKLAARICCLINLYINL